LHTLSLYIWELAVAVGIFGWGLAGLQLLRFNRPPLALAGSFGVALLITLGGWMNLLHLLSPTAMYVLVGTGILLAAYTAFQSSRRGSEPTPAEPWDLPSKIVVGAALLVLAAMMLGSLRPLVWCTDDLVGYIAFAKKTLDIHSLQSDPFSERRIVSGLGGGIFLDALMLSQGDFRALKFIDECFGLGLYALSLWTIGRLWKTPRWAVGLGLIGIPIATLIQANLTIVFLTSAASLAILIVLFKTSTDEGWSGRGTLVIGIIAGALLTTKSTNIVFLLLFWFLTLVLLMLLKQRARVLKQGAIALLVAILIALPWSIAQRANEGTYLYPMLGKGYHASAYHILPDPSQAGSLTIAAFVAAPDLLMMLGCLLAAWLLTRGWAAWWRASIFGFAAAAALVVPAIALSTGGEGVERYTAPFTMPMVLLLVFLVSQPRRGHDLHPGRFVGIFVLAISGFYVTHFIGYRLQWYRQETHLLYEAVGRLPRVPTPYRKVADSPYFKQEEERDLRGQAVLPMGATALSVVESPYGFDYQRNRIYICDFCGMSGLPPGMPVDQGAQAIREYLLSLGIPYIIFDRRRDDWHRPWEEYTRNPHGLGVRYMYHNEVDAHLQVLWGLLEVYVNSHVTKQLYDIVNSSPIIYDDGILVVARIGTPQSAVTTH
jgi:hypothetical protein